jgi:hypothetical protein
MIDERYQTPAAVEAAIKAAAQNASSADSSLPVSDRIRQAHFDRFLSRVFSEGENSDWVLKGGTAMLARVASARTTTDIDLFRRVQSLDAAVRDLRRLAAFDLGDHFRFEFDRADPSIAGNQQTYTEGCRVTFDVYVGASRRGQLHIDLVVGAVVTDDITVQPPENRLSLPKLVTHDYRLYPVVDQIADKVCATLAVYNGRPSSREKDLVDLVVLAVTQDVDGFRLRRALAAESRARSIDLPEHFVVPATWGRGYARDAAEVPACRAYPTVPAAMLLMTDFLDPALRGDADARVWSARDLDWTVLPAAPTDLS